MIYHMMNILHVASEGFPSHDEACKAILEERKNQITIQVTNLQATLDIINYKITHFQRIKTGKIPN